MPKNLFIPPLGTEITLAEPWTFDLYREFRNDSLISILGVKFPEADYYERLKQKESVTLPAGSVLKVDRLYIKKGQGDFDSVTFYLKGASKPGYKRSYVGGDGKERTYTVPKKAARFWVKLHDANKIAMVD